MGYYPSLREYVHTLESREKLFRIQREVCRETELHPLVRWQFRGLPESERRAFLFENVANAAAANTRCQFCPGPALPPARFMPWAWAAERKRSSIAGSMHRKIPACVRQGSLWGL